MAYVMREAVCVGDILDLSPRLFQNLVGRRQQGYLKKSLDLTNAEDRPHPVVGTADWLAGGGASLDTRLGGVLWY